MSNDLKNSNSLDKKITDEIIAAAIQKNRIEGRPEVALYLERIGQTRLDLPIKSIFGECAICLSDEAAFEGYITFCNHQFHAECLEKWVRKQSSCPICRGSI